MLAKYSLRTVNVKCEDLRARGARSWLRTHRADGIHPRRLSILDYLECLTQHL